MPRKVVLLLPSDVPSATIERPHYGEVLARRTGATVRVQLMAKPGSTATSRITVPAETVSLRAVPSHELDEGAPGWLLYSAVYFQSDGQFYHGQVTAYANGAYTITTQSRTAVIPYSAVREIAPVIVFLLWSSRLVSAIKSVEKMERAHATILSRILGQRGCRATKATAKILKGVAVAVSIPRASDELSWRSPASGQVKQVSMGHVVNFAFYRDGNRTPPASVALGEFFWNDPSSSPTDEAPTTTVSANSTETRTRPRDESTDEAEAEDAESGFADLLDEYADAHVHSKRRRIAATANDNNPFRDPASRAILQALASAPRLLSAYISQLQAMHGPEAATTSSTLHDSTGVRAMDESRTSEQQFLTQQRFAHTRAPSYRTTCHVSNSSDASDQHLRSRWEEEHTDRQTQFRPTRAQQEVHGAITAGVYIGKTPDSFIDHARNSAATKFLPHPAVLSRLYEFQFGPCSLSVLHFVHFGFQAQLLESETKKVNLQNFSPSLNLPEPPRLPRFADLVDALCVLDAFASEFFEDSTRRFIAAAKAFGDELRELEPWSTLEVKGLAFWYNKVFGGYRLAIVHDLASGEATRHRAKDRFSIQDGKLNGILMRFSRNSKLRRRSQEQHDSFVPTREVGFPQSDRFGAKRKHQKIPQEVLRHVPRRNGLQLCLKSISTQGCPSKTPGQCTQSFLAHFAPENLHSTVKTYVEERFGGVSTKQEEN